MRRFLTLVCLFCVAIPAGISFSGCTRNPGADYCNGLGYGTKIGTVTSITMQPQTAGITLAYGQTTTVQSPTAYDCKGNSVSISSAGYSYGTTNNQIADISPSGSLCAGTWNRNTGGGIADYTYCYAPSPSPSTKGLPYGIAYLTATANSVTSNPVEVYIHAPVTSISLVTTPVSGSSSTGCYSQNQTAQLDAEACYYTTYNGVANQYEFCAPSSVVSSGKYACPGGVVSGATLSTCSSTIGTLSYAVGTSSVASIDSTTNVITASMPGTTNISATLSQTASSIGYFSTCPPKSISLTTSSGGTSEVVTQGTTQSLTTTVIDTNNKTINGLTLTFESTNPIDISASGTGSITATYPGVASIYASCQPSTCNPAPINELGVYGTGLPITSSPVKVVVPGTTSDYVWFGAPGMSQYFASIELITGNPGSTVKLPYVPNSMLMDQGGTSLYFGSSHELMVYSTANNTLSTAATAVPGVVLAVSPNNSLVLVNDQSRDIFYLYNVSSSAATATFSGLGAAAAWTPDSETLYIVDSASLGGNHTDTLYVYNSNVGWSSYDLSSSGGATNLALTVPAIGAYLSGYPTVAHTWCPTGTVGTSSSFLYYPQPSADAVSVDTSVLSATNDGAHILGAILNGSGINLSDIGVSIPTTVCGGVGSGAPALGGSLTGLSTDPSINSAATALSLGTGVTATAVNQVVTGTAPNNTSTTTAAPIAFVTYNASSSVAAQLPYYLPKSSNAGTASFISFADATSATPPTAPLAGVFSPDNHYFFVSTAGDNEVHYISIPTNVSTSNPPTDSQQISPNLPACTSSDVGCSSSSPGTGYVPATVITVKPRTVT
jgi:hypothetical protein